MQCAQPLQGALLAACATPALAGTVTVIVVPEDLTQAYKTAFEKANPGITLEILNKNTVSGIAYVRETPAGQRPEVFWASARPTPSRCWAATNCWPSRRMWPTRTCRTRSTTTPSTTRAACTWARRWPATASSTTRYIAAHKIPAPVEWEGPAGAALVRPRRHHLALALRAPCT